MSVSGPKLVLSASVKRSEHLGCCAGKSVRGRVLKSLRVLRKLRKACSHYCPEEGGAEAGIQRGCKGDKQGLLGGTEMALVGDEAEQ